MQKTVTVIGGSGFIGRATVEMLARAKMRVIVLCRNAARAGADGHRPGGRGLRGGAGRGRRSEREAAAQAPLRPLRRSSDCCGGA